MSTVTASIEADRNDLINRVWNGDVTMPAKDGHKLYDAKAFMAERIRMVDNGDGTVTFTRSNPAPSSRPKHEYVMPPCTDRVMCLLDACLERKSSYNFLLTGHKGTGKTQFVKEVARRKGYRLFQYNGSITTVDTDLIGNIEVRIDEDTNHPVTDYIPGVLVQAMTEGTQVDKHGRQVMDANGMPIVTGAPGMFFLDEFATVPGSVITGIFQHVMEVPRDPAEGRSLVIKFDGNRIIRSHPSFVMVFAGNTAGKGVTDERYMGYTSQDNIHDDSTLDRMSATFEFEYNEEAEEQIVLSYLRDELETDNVLRFRDEMRRMFDDGRVSTLLSTRGIVGICDLAERYMERKYDNPLVQAIVDNLFSRLGGDELPAWNQTMRMVWGYDYLEEKAKAKNAKARARSRR